eukprot:2515569-Pyramimonas_sp.AAC.1
MAWTTMRAICPLVTGTSAGGGIAPAAPPPSVKAPAGSSTGTGRWRGPAGNSPAPLTPSATTGEGAA